MSRDYEDLMARYEANYQDADPEMAGLRKAARDQEQRRQRIARELPSDPHMTFWTVSIPEGQRTLADVELELAAGRYGHRPEPWLGPDGPLAIPAVRDNQVRYKDLIELWRTDRGEYEDELRRRGLIR